MTAEHGAQPPLDLTPPVTERRPFDISFATTGERTLALVGLMAAIEVEAGLSLPGKPDFADAVTLPPRPDETKDAYNTDPDQAWTGDEVLAKLRDLRQRQAFATIGLHGITSTVATNYRKIFAEIVHHDEDEPLQEVAELGGTTGETIMELIGRAPRRIQIASEPSMNATRTHKERRETDLRASVAISLITGEPICTVHKSENVFGARARLSLDPALRGLGPITTTHVINNIRRHHGSDSPNRVVPLEPDVAADIAAARRRLASSPRHTD